MRTAKILPVLAIVAAAPALRSQDARAVMEESLAKQRESIARQMAAIRAQIGASATEQQPADSFFTVPWVFPATVFSTIAQCNPLAPGQIGPLVAEVSRRENLPPELLRAVIEKESGYRPCAVSRKGAQGLMQLMPETAALLGVDDVFDPRQNVQAGARFLKQLLRRYEGNVPLALAAYNAGPGRVEAAGGVPFIRETREYVKAILGSLRPRPGGN